MSVPLIVDTDWLKERLEDPKLRLLDARTFLNVDKNNEGPNIQSGKKAYEEEHIPGAVFVDILNDLSNQDSNYYFTVPSREKFTNKMSEIGVGDIDNYVVIYDQGIQGNSSNVASFWASRLAWNLRYEGFNNIAVLDGGINKWTKEGFAVTNEISIYPKAVFNAQRNPSLLASTEDVQEAIGDEDTILINSLSEADFRGDTKTYGRAGHIPSSVNIFFGKHSNPKTFELYDEATLRKTFDQIGALDNNKKIILYCGGGIAATWNALLLKKLGQQNIAVYDGSMMEWSSNPSLPLHTIK